MGQKSEHGIYDYKTSKRNQKTIIVEHDHELSVRVYQLQGGNKDSNREELPMQRYEKCIFIVFCRNDE